MASGRDPALLCHCEPGSQGEVPLFRVRFLNPAYKRNPKSGRSRFWSGIQKRDNLSPEEIASSLKALLAMTMVESRVQSSHTCHCERAPQREAISQWSRLPRPRRAKRVGQSNLERLLHEPPCSENRILLPARSSCFDCRRLFKEREYCDRSFRINSGRSNN